MKRISNNLKNIGQNIEKSRHRQLERKAREDRRRALALQTGKTEEELRSKESQLAKERTPDPPATEEPPAVKVTKKAPKKKAAKAAKETSEDVFDFEEDDDDLF